MSAERTTRKPQMHTLKMTLAQLWQLKEQLEAASWPEARNDADNALLAIVNAAYQAAEKKEGKRLA